MLQQVRTNIKYIIIYKKKDIWIREILPKSKNASLVVLDTSHDLYEILLLYLQRLMWRH